MIGKNQVRPGRKMQPAAHVDTSAAEVIELGYQSSRIYHDSRTDDGVLAGPKDSARNQLQDKTVAIENDGMSRIVAARTAGNVIKRSRHVIDDLPLALVTPLRAHYDDRFHSRSSSLSLAGIWAALCLARTDRALSCGSFGEIPRFRWSLGTAIMMGSPLSRGLRRRNIVLAARRERQGRPSDDGG